MKKLLYSLLATVAAVSSIAQGTIFFNNRTSTGDVPIYAPDGGIGNGKPRLGECPIVSSACEPGHYV
jgi:hypothetical protein